MSPSQHINAVVFILYGIVVVGVISLNIPDCDNQTGIINNALTNCSYPFINCSGGNSQYCVDRENCSDTYNCNATIITTTVIPPTNQTTTPIPNQSSSTTNSIGNNSTLSSAEVRQHCQPGVTQKYPYPNNNNYYYYCINGYLLVEQCPVCHSFNMDNGTCVAPITKCTFN